MCWDLEWTDLFYCIMTARLSTWVKGDMSIWRIKPLETQVEQASVKLSSFGLFFCKRRLQLTPVNIYKKHDKDFELHAKTFFHHCLLVVVGEVYGFFCMYLAHSASPVQEINAFWRLQCVIFFWFLGDYHTEVLTSTWETCYLVV